MDIQDIELFSKVLLAHIIVIIIAASIIWMLWVYFSGFLAVVGITLTIVLTVVLVGWAATTVGDFWKNR